MLYVAVGMVGMLGMAALTVDMGLAYISRTQAQAAVDAIALHAAANMIDVETGPTAVITQGLSETAGIAMATETSAYPNSSLTINAGDLQYGDWQFATGTLAAADLLDPDTFNAVQANLSLTGVQNQAVPTLMMRLLPGNQTSINVSCSATAYLGFAGKVGPGEVDLPIAIPCCLLGLDEQCGGTYCENGEAPVMNPCPLIRDPSITSSCVQFSTTAEQTGCWTQFTGDSPSINTNELTTIVRDGNGDPLEVDSQIYLDNGEKTPVIQDIKDRFYDNPDNDTDGDGVSDSWLIQMPVVSCQNEDICAKGNPAPVTGFVCANVREVIIDGSNKSIRMDFVCPQSNPALFEKCQIGGSTTGGENFGIRADIPVLVK